MIIMKQEKHDDKHIKKPMMIMKHEKHDDKHIFF
jgi:hypothetical protein